MAKRSMYRRVDVEIQSKEQFPILSYVQQSEQIAEEYLGTIKEAVIQRKGKFPKDLTDREEVIRRRADEVLLRARNLAKFVDQFAKNKNQKNKKQIFEVVKQAAYMGAHLAQEREKLLADSRWMRGVVTGPANKGKSGRKAKRVKLLQEIIEKSVYKASDLQRGCNNNRTVVFHEFQNALKTKDLGTATRETFYTYMKEILSANTLSD